MSAEQIIAEPEIPAPGTVAPLLPLALLEAVRAHDRPDELLEDEDLAASLPRRFGLTGVVATQIERYQSELRRGRQVPAEDVADLFRLILRRPDAGLILESAGHLAARRLFERIPRPAASALRILPGRATRAAAKRAAQSMLRRIHINGHRLEVNRDPWTAQLFEPLTMGLDPDGLACNFYAGLIEECFSLYTKERPSVAHPHCTTHGASYCEWSLTD